MIIAGPAYIKRGSAVFRSETDITITITKDTKERKESIIGKFDEILLAVKAEIKFKPVEWQHLDELFPWAKLKLGQCLFGDDDVPTEIYSADGQCYTFHRTAVTASPSIGAGVEKDLLGEATITALIASNKNYGDVDALYARKEATFEPVDLVEEAIFSIAYSVSYGDIVLDTEEGIDIEISPTINERKRDEVGVFDYTFGGCEYTAKFKPINITEDQYNSIANPNGGVDRGRSLRAISQDLFVSGANVGDPKFKITKAICAGSQTLTFGLEAQRFGELEFRATSTQYDVPKFEISSVQ